MSGAAPEPLHARLRRLAAERDAADRLYNEALTALDQTRRPPLDVTPPHQPFDDAQGAALNESWNVASAEPVFAAGLKGRLGRFVWGLVGPYLQRQTAFNSLVVDHVNRNLASARQSHTSMQASLEALRTQIVWLEHFHARLMLFLQQITGYVDTKDRDMQGPALILNAAISASTEDAAKRWESLDARTSSLEHALESRTRGLEAAHEDLRGMIGAAQQAVMVLKREVERLAAAGPAGPGVAAAAPAVPPDAAAFATALDAYKYVGFEDRFRGSRDVIRQRLATYVPYFEGRTDVLDIGCGRGEFLDLLGAAGISARGIDLNHEMAETCRARGLDVAEADAVGYLAGLPDGSLGGIFAAQVVEHLEPAYLLRCLDLAFHKLRPGGRLVLETLNPACWVAFFESYIRDITHRWPLHPETLRYLVTASGFVRADIEFRSPVPEPDRLERATAPSADPVVAELIDTFNANMAKLNARMFTDMDYAIVATR